MAAKIIFVAVAVMCTFGALNASPAPTPKLTPDDVVNRVEECLVVNSTVKEAQDYVNEKVTDIMNQLDKSFLNVDWTTIVDDLVQKATAEGRDIAECLAIQEQLPAVVDQMRAQVMQCVETAQQGLNDAIDALKALSPKDDAILADTKKDVAQCVDSDCLLKILIKQETAGMFVFGDAKLKQARIIYKANDMNDDVKTCAFQSTQNSVAAINEIAAATAICIQSKSQN